MTLRAGQTLKYDIKVGGEPPPTKSWFKNGEQLKNDNRTKIESEDYRAKITVSNVTRKDTGVYKIVVKNVNGEEDAEARVTVLDKPGAPEGPLDVSEVHAEGCKLKWKPPLDDGGMPLDGYVIEKMDTQTGRWVPCGRTMGDEFNVENLTPGQEYKFRVKAVNPEGESEPLENETTVVAKNPYNPPGAPENAEVTDWDKEWMTVKWDPPLKDGGNPVQNYIVEKKEKGTGVWTKAATVDGNVTIAKVIDLIPGETYEFRVKAVNAAGPGEPSDATKPQVAKPRRSKCFASSNYSCHNQIYYRYIIISKQCIFLLVSNKAIVFCIK